MTRIVSQTRCGGAGAMPDGTRWNGRGGNAHPMTSTDTDHHENPSDDDRVAIVSGLRTPFAKAGGALARMRSLELGVQVVKELVQRVDLDPKEVTLCVFGQAVPTIDWLNIAREIVVRTELTKSTEAYAVSHAGACSIQAMTNGADVIAARRHDAVIVGGADSVSNAPPQLSDELRDTLRRARRAGNWTARLKTFKSLSSEALRLATPGYARELPTGQTMGEASEKMAKLNGISRSEQDAIAHSSHRKAARAWANGGYRREVMLVIAPPYERAIEEDELVRPDCSIPELTKLPPIFDERHGSVTAGNIAPASDGSCALLLMRQAKAVACGYRPLAFIKSWAYAAVDPGWQLLMAPVIAASRALDRSGLTVPDIDLFEVHEASAAQVACNLQAMASDRFATEHLGRNKALGEIEPHKLNVNGGSIALGHPLAATGSRMVLSAAHELGNRGGKYALVMVGAAGGLGAAVLLEAP